MWAFTSVLSVYYVICILPLKRYMSVVGHMLEQGGKMVKRRFIGAWVLRPVVSGVILLFGALGFILSCGRVNPVLAAAGAKLGMWLRMLVEMFDFAHGGI